MGCFLSRSTGPNSPYPGGNTTDASARAINPPHLTLPDSSHSSALVSLRSSHQTHNQRRSRRISEPLDQRMGKPLRLHEWISDDHAWTREELRRERVDFFDTRVTGRPEIWQTIHVALQVLWEPETPNVHADGGSNLRTAQTMLSAADISLPTGNLANGAYDSLGNYYQIPQWIVSDPVNMGEDQDEHGDINEDICISEVLIDRDLSKESVAGDGESKGKGLDDLEETFVLCARLSESGRDVQITINKSETVSSVCRKIAEESGLNHTKKIRLAYMGKILKEATPLEKQGWQPGHIVNALVFTR